MEHHLFPKYPAKGGFDVPYVCTADANDEPYDGQDFLSYPSRRGMPWMAVDRNNIDESRTRINSRYFPGSIKEQEAFYQSWLFFGLLQTFLGSSYKAGDYIRQVNGEAIITTEKLFDTISEYWASRSTSLSREEHQAEWQEAARCLNVVHNVLPGCHKDFDWRLRLSLESIAELFGRAIAYLALDASIQLSPRVPIAYNDDFPPTRIKQDMLAIGWCPSEIAVLSTRFNSLQTKMFLSRLEKLPLKDHSKCTDDACIFYQINLNHSYEPCHRPDCNGCQPTNNIDTEVASVLKTTSIPLLRVIGDAQRVHLEVVPSSPEAQYVPLSHVWADGLGNPFECSLASCQLFYLSKLIGQLQDTAAEIRDKGTHEPQDPTELFLWIDTICCPVQPYNLKLVAISRMRAVYSNATHVLVLDKGLSSISSQDLESIEVLLRIFTSGWMQRLWTLQEGVLPKRLWIQLADGPIELDKLMERSVTAQKVVDTRLVCLNSDIWEYWKGLRVAQGMKAPLMEGELGELGSKLISLDHSLINRKVSVASDEPLCIGTLMNLPESFLANVPTSLEDRMCRLWLALSEQHGGLPQDMIALNYPRLATPGFRWAPRTLLVSGPAMRVMQWGDKTFGRVTEEGFLVRYRGFILHLDARATNLPDPSDVLGAGTNTPISFKHLGKRYLLLRSSQSEHPLGRWARYDTHQEMIDKRFAVIYRKLGFGQPDEGTYFAHLCEIESGQGPQSQPKIRLVRPMQLMASNKLFGLLYDHVEAMADEVLALLESDGHERTANDSMEKRSESVLQGGAITALKGETGLFELMQVLFHTDDREHLAHRLVFLTRVRMRYHGHTELPENQLAILTKQNGGIAPQDLEDIEWPWCVT